MGSRMLQIQMTRVAQPKHKRNALVQTSFFAVRNVLTQGVSEPKNKGKLTGEVLVNLFDFIHALADSA